MSKRVNVEYYAFFRDRRGTASEEVETDARTKRELYCELSHRHGLEIPSSAVLVATGDEFADMDEELKDGEKVAFLPPVAGG